MAVAVAVQALHPAKPPVKPVEPVQRTHAPAGVVAVYVDKQVVQTVALVHTEHPVEQAVHAVGAFNMNPELQEVQVLTVDKTDVAAHEAQLAGPPEVAQAA